MSEATPRFSASNGGRQRVRLIAAMGLLATTAIAAGALGSLLSGAGASPSTTAHPEDATKAAIEALGPGGGELLDPASLLERRVIEAEHSVDQARAALHRAREAGVDASVLERFERRLELLGESPLEQVRRNYAPPPEPVPESSQPAHLQPATAGARSL